MPVSTNKIIQWWVFKEDSRGRVKAMLELYVPAERRSKGVRAEWVRIG
jgi:hypothetical protein